MLTFPSFAIVLVFLRFKKLVSNVAGYLQSLFGVYSLRIENVGVRRPPSDDVKIQGIANPSAFRKVLLVIELVIVVCDFKKEGISLVYAPWCPFQAVLARLSYMRSEIVSRQVSTIEDMPSLRIDHSSALAWVCQMSL